MVSFSAFSHPGLRRLDREHRQPPHTALQQDDQYIRTFMSEIVSVFKDTAQLNPLLYDRITKFSIKLNRVATLLPQSPQVTLAGRLGVPRHRRSLHEALLVLKKELIDAQLQSKVSRDVDS